MKHIASILAAAALFGASALSAGCGGALEGGLTPPEAVSTSDTAAGDATQVMLEPVDIWDAEGAGEPSVVKSGGRELHVRKRGAALFKRAWMRLGLYWNSKRPNDIFIGAVALGPEVQIKSLQMDIDGRKVRLEPTGDFNFVPGKRGVFDTQERHVGSFIANAEWLRSVVQARRSVAVHLETSRGVLLGDLNVVAGDNENDLRNSAKSRFAEFLAARDSAARN